MSETHSVGQELQEQLLATARKGRQRVQATVRTVTATAQAIQPQLPSLPKPSLNLPRVPKPAQIREAAPTLIAKVPGGDQIKSGVQELADQLKTAQGKVASKVTSTVAQSKVPGKVSSQVRHAAAAANKATPLAKQAVAEFRHAATAATPLARQAVAEFRHAATAAGPLVRQAVAVFVKDGEPAEITAADQAERPAEAGQAERKPRAKDTADGAGAAAASEDGAKATPSASARKPRTKSSGK